MPLTSEKRQLIRDHFKKLFGRECNRCGSNFDLEFHHIIPNGWGRSRGSTARCWDLFEAYNEDNLELLCHDCHTQHHKQVRK